MKKNQISNFMNHKLTIVIIPVLCVLLIGLSIGISYSFSLTDIDLNGNGDLDVGDVVKLRRFILNDDNNNVTISFEGENIKYLNGQTFEASIDSDVIAYMIPNTGYVISGVTCSNDQQSVYSKNFVEISDATSDSICDIETTEKTALTLKSVNLTDSTYNSSSMLSTQQINLTKSLPDIVNIDSIENSKGEVQKYFVSNGDLTILGNSEEVRSTRYVTVDFSSIIRPADAYCDYGKLSNNECISTVGDYYYEMRSVQCFQDGRVFLGNTYCMEGYISYINNEPCPPAETLKKDIVINDEYRCEWQGNQTPRYSCINGEQQVYDRCYGCEQGYLDYDNINVCRDEQVVMDYYNEYNFTINYYIVGES